MVIKYKNPLKNQLHAKWNVEIDSPELHTADINPTST